MNPHRDYWKSLRNFLLTATLLIIAAVLGLLVWGLWELLGSLLGAKS